MKIRMELGVESYDIIIERGSLCRAGEYLNLKRKVMIVTDSGVPREYAETIKACSADGYIVTVEAGEGSKSMATAETILSEMLKLGFSRRDCVVAVGGGVVGDLAGFVASLYMRGVDFYNIPTTVLSEVDSSIGGKVAVNFGGVKNTVGAFYQPKAVLIDPDTLKTLEPRQVVNGLIEALKSGAIRDRVLFEMFESDDYLENIDEIIYRSLSVKKEVVEIDPKESGLRKILNYGHTVGHGIESAAEGKLLHGECVALGMLYLSSDEVKERLIKIYDRMGLGERFADYYEGRINLERIKSAMSHDKKADGATCSVVTVNEVGCCSIEEWQMTKLFERIEEC